MPNIIDIFNDDAFSTSTLTDSINNLEHVPGRAGQVVFAQLEPGVDAHGVSTLDVSVEQVDETLTLIPTSSMPSSHR